MRSELIDDRHLARVGGRAGQFARVLEAPRRLDPVLEPSRGELRADVVVMDVSMPGLNGIEATRRIADALPGTKVIALSMHADRRYVHAMLGAGASGYLLKDAEADDIADAIRTVAAGDVVLPPAVARTLVAGSRRAPAPEPSLTAREREVIGLVAAGIGAFAPAYDQRQRQCLDHHQRRCFRRGAWRAEGRAKKTCRRRSRSSIRR